MDIMAMLRSGAKNTQEKRVKKGDHLAAERSIVLVLLPPQLVVLSV